MKPLPVLILLLACLGALLAAGCTSPAGSPPPTASLQPTLSAEDAIRNLRDQYPAPGELLEINGTRMHLRCQGTGSPVVIMEAGSGDCSLTWGLVQQNVSQFTRVCTYDRPGHGWSDPAPEPLSAQNVTGRLHTLLARAGIPGPYVMAGHSLGGIFVRSYAHRYPGDVAGMVLVDPGSERVPERTGGNFSSDIHAAVTAKRAALHEMGRDAARGTFARNLSLLDGYTDPRLPAWECEAYRALFATEPWFWDACADDGKQAFLIWDEVAAENITQVGDIPLVVISSGNNMSIYADPARAAHEDAVWRTLQNEMAAESPQGRYLVAENSGHNIQIEQPAIVTEAIRSVVQEVRDHQKG
jgi:pimeloyl-ACP methyl ester carboxylesterase